MLANRVHHLAEERDVVEFLAALEFPGQLAAAFENLAAKALDLIGRHTSEVVVQGLARFELLAVDEQGIWPREGVAVFIEVPEQLEAAGHGSRRAVLILAQESGDIVIHQLRGGRVVADHDEARRDADAGLFPLLIGLLVVAVQRFQGGLKLRRQAQRVERFRLAAALLRHLRSDVLPEIAVHRHLLARNVVGDRHAGQLDDPAFDGVHERKIVHRPGEQRPFGIARTAEEEGRCRKIDDAGQTQLAVHGLQAGNPEAGGLLVPLGLLLVVAFQVLVVGVLRLLAVAVVRLIVQREDILHPHQVGHDPLQHLALGFQRLQRFAAQPSSAARVPLETSVLSRSLKA